jgi:hypothetical protein
VGHTPSFRIGDNPFAFEDDTLELAGENRMQISRRGFLNVFGLSILSLALNGCLGWFDIFADRRPLSGTYSLMQGEGDPGNGLFVMKKGGAISIAGPLHEIGWNQTYILFTDDNWPMRWSVIDVASDKVLKITENQRVADDRFKGIDILTSKDAWTAAKQRH